MSKGKPLEHVRRRLNGASNDRLDSYLSRVSSDKNPKHFDEKVRELLLLHSKIPEEVRFVNKHLDAIGYTQSKYQFSQIEEQLSNFQQPNHKYYGWLATFRKAKSSIMAEFEGCNLSPVQFNTERELLDNVPNRKAHAGWTAIETGIFSKGELFGDRVLRTYRQKETTAMLKGTFDAPIILGTRTQAAGGFVDGEPVDWFKSKTRLISIIDAYQTMAELRFAKPFQEELNTRSWYAGGVDDSQILRHVTNMRERFEYYVSIDYSKFDQSISNWLIHEAFDIVRSAYGSLSDSDARLFRVLRNDFINKDFVAYSDYLVHAEKGVPSGSMFTQVIDSIVNRLMIVTFMNSCRIPTDAYDMCIMGDDNIIYSQDPIDVNSLSTYLLQVFGVTVSPEKSSFGTSSDDPEFLSRVWRRGGVDRETREVLTKLLFPERLRPYATTDLEPIEIIHSYSTAFPLAMKRIIKSGEIESKYNISTMFRGGNLEHVSGFASFRARYLKPKILTRRERKPVQSE